MKEGSSGTFSSLITIGGLFAYNIAKQSKLEKLNEPVDYDEDSKSFSETMSMATSTNQSQMKHHASITSLTAEKNTKVDNMARCTSLISLIGN